MCSRYCSRHQICAALALQFHAGSDWKQIMTFLAGFLLGNLIVGWVEANQCDHHSLLQLAEPHRYDGHCPRILYERTLVTSHFLENNACNQPCAKKSGTFPWTNSADELKYLYVHIPKTGGYSFMTDAQKVSGKIPIVHNGERCLDYASLWHGNTSIAITFRNPFSHVLSQFVHCKYYTGKILNEVRPFFPQGPGLYGGFLV